MSDIRAVRPSWFIKPISHLFWADLLKNSAFSPICTKTEDSGYTSASPQQAKSVLVKLFLTSIQHDLTSGQSSPSPRTTACTWTSCWSPGERVNRSVWLSASQQIHKQLKMNCISRAEAGCIILDLGPKIVQRDIHRVPLVLDEGHI